MTILKPPIMATLVGGHADGKVVELLGIYHEELKRDKRFSRRFISGRYDWEETKDGKIIGRFKGYFYNGQRVNKLGHKIGKRS
jgi:hypothetical protein